MSSVKGRIVRLLGGLALKRGGIVAAQELGGFRRLVVRSEVASVAAGTKVQLLLPSNDMRTYTPIPAPEGFALLAWTGAGGPGARWMSQARAGDELRFVGPQRSLELDAGPVVLVGDETSVAVAAAFAAARPGLLRAVIQTDAPAEVRAAAAAVALGDVETVARGDTAATVAAVTAGGSRDLRVALTGGSALVLEVRDALRRAGVQRVKTKTYWIPGRAGLD